MIQPQYTNNICLDIVGAIDSLPGLSLRHEAFGQEWRFYPLENQNALAFSKVDRESESNSEIVPTDSDEELRDGSGSISDESEEVFVKKPKAFSQDEDSSESYERSVVSKGSRSEEGSGSINPRSKDLGSEGSGSKESEKDQK